MQLRQRCHHVLQPQSSGGAGKLCGSPEASPQKNAGWDPARPQCRLKKEKSKTKQTNMTFLVNWRPWRPASSANSPMGFKMELEKFMRRITRAVACGSKEWEWVPQEHFQQRHSTHGCSPEHEDVAQPQPSVCTCSTASSPRCLG